MPYRRLLGNFIQLERRTWEDVAPELARLLRRIFDSESGGLPAGFGNQTPTEISADGTSGPGDQTDGWASISHDHPVATAPAIGLGNASIEGVDSELARADHQHKRDVRVKEDGTDIATRNALNFVNGLLDWEVVDDLGGDKVDIGVVGGAGLRRGFGAVIQGFPIPGDLVAYARVPFSGIITGWSIVADRVGSIVVDVWKDSWDNFPPTVADSITGSEKPTLTAQQKNEDQDLTTWTTDIAAGDVVGIYVESASTVRNVQVLVWVSPT